MGQRRWQKLVRRRWLRLLIEVALLLLLRQRRLQRDIPGLTVRVQASSCGGSARRGVQISSKVASLQVLELENWELANGSWQEELGLRQLRWSELARAASPGVTSSTRRRSRCSMHRAHQQSRHHGHT